MAVESKQQQSSSSTSAASSSSTTLPLSSIYPINTHMELTLKNTNDKIQGTIYCTDEISNTIVLKTSLVHTTLSSQITVINADVVMDRRRVIVEGDDDNESGEGGGAAAEGAQQQQQQQQVTEVLPNVSRRMVEERERRAIKLMEESFSHVNQKASPEGQKIFDKLLKACNQVTWVDGESILVLGEIRVDPPYTSNECVLVNRKGGSGLDGHSLERVKNIVNAAAAASK